MVYLLDPMARSREVAKNSKPAILCISNVVGIAGSHAEDIDTAIDVHVEGTKRRIIAADGNIVPSLRIRMVGEADEFRSTEHLEVVKVPVEIEGRKRYRCI